MQNTEKVKAQIRAAFAQVEYPGDWCLRRSNEGDEPFLLEQEFKGKDKWEVLDPKFIDQAPGGFASALSFFSEEAFRFYIPAYLIADIDECLQYSNPIFHLTHGLTNSSRNDRINPRRYGDRTWFDHAQHRFSVFTREQAAAIVAYLTLKRNAENIIEFEQQQIDEALKNYWYQRAPTLENFE
ncbi:DUF6714 family protein [Leptolyngbya sp. FACHB-711]|uniref:DUF6714 family protein n=1 Tax=unclassified Leptolyngbya TaxID=2650499 RepID=UPI0016869B10|nr:DUF6714 family protein [Leptolyngbya sp. FACHB-711]MBD1850892.1 hypothetical protein [Cyanobacteria bacterium FACHB-502]MBD2027803.1 hypothetical protein [Leptolyngbya sp. FACHB-711]